MNLYVGTSGYGYKEWKGSFYPTDLPAKRMLNYYGENFGTVEVNNTFYRLPTTEVVEAWTREVPAGFKFAVKAPQMITHRQRLKGAGESMAEFLRVASVLEKRLGPLLFQLPPFLKKDAPLLRDFLALLPRQTRTAFEFRHASWFDQEIFDLLSDHCCALCIAEAENDLEVPFVSTADWGYLRLRKDDYTDRELKKWAAQVQQQEWQDAYVFFKHDDSGNAPKLGKKFLSAARGGVN